MRDFKALTQNELKCHNVHLSKPSLEVTSMCETPPLVIFAGTPSTADTSYNSNYELQLSSKKNDFYQDNFDCFRSTSKCLSETDAFNADQSLNLEAALLHAKAKQDILIESLNSLKAELADKTERLKEKQILFDTLECEYRKIKTNFRDFLDTALESSTVDTNSCQNIEEDDQMRTAIFGSISSSEKKSTQNNFNTVTDFETIKEASLWNSKYGKQLRAVVSTLKSTSEYVQEVLQKNSYLEARCSALAMDRDQRIRELHEELGHTRRQRDEADSAVTSITREHEATKKELEELHDELCKVHERNQQVKMLTTDYEALQANVETMKITISSLEVKNEALQDELNLHKELLATEIMRQRDYWEIIEANNPTTDSVVAHLTKLEETINLNQCKFSTKLEALESENTELNLTVRDLKLKLNCTERELLAKTENIEQLQRDITLLNKRFLSVNEQNKKLEEQLTKTKADEIQLNEMKELLSAERESNESKKNEIEDHINLVKESNARFSDLTERYNIIEKILQDRQKDKEKMLNEALKSAESLYKKADFYRTKWELSSEEVIVLKKELEDAEDQKNRILQSAELECLRQLRQLRHQYTSEQQSLLEKFESDMLKLRSQHEFEMNDFRMQREEKLDLIAGHYEEYIKDQKITHEKQLNELLEKKNDEILQNKTEHEKTLKEIDTYFKNELQKKHEKFEEKCASITESFQRELQSILCKKTEEILEKDHEIEKLKQTLEEQKILFEQKISAYDLNLQFYKQNNESTCSNTTYTLNNDDTIRALETKMQLAETQFIQSINSLRAEHSESLEQMTHKIELLQRKNDSMVEDNQRLAEALKKKNEEIESIFTKFKEQTKKHKEEKDSLLSDLEKTENAYSKVISKMPSTDLDNSIDENNAMKEKNMLFEQLKEMKELNSELEIRLEQQKALLNSQLDEKTNRIEFLLSCNEHLAHIVERNTELEKNQQKLEEQLKDATEAKFKAVAKVEAENSKIRKVLDITQKSYESLKTDHEECKKELMHVLEQLNIYKTKVQNIDLLEKRITSLNCEILTFKNKLDENESIDHDVDCYPSTSDQLEAIKRLNQDLVTSREKTKNLYKDLQNYQKQLEGTLKTQSDLISLEYKMKLQEKETQRLQEQLNYKQRIIEELEKQLNQNHSTSTIKDSKGDSEYDGYVLQISAERIDNLSKQCVELLEQKTNYEQEKRILLHRMEIEKQILSQCLEQKDRQMHHLIETNKRAERLLTRNAELEEALWKQNLELSELKESAKVLQDSTGEAESFKLEGSLEQAQKEIVFLRNLLDDRENYIKELNSQLKDLHPSCTNVSEGIQNKFELQATASDELRFREEENLLKILVDKTTDLQSEVARLYYSKDYTALQCCNIVQISKAMPIHPTSHEIKLSDEIDSSRSDYISGNTETSILLARVENLLMERASLLQLVDIFSKIIEDVDKDISECKLVAIQYNKLKGIMQDLVKVLNNQKSSIHHVLTSANLSLEQHSELSKICEELLNQEGEDILIKLLNKNQKLKGVLGSIRNVISSNSSKTGESSSEIDYACIEEMEAKIGKSEIQSRSYIEELGPITTDALNDTISTTTESQSRVKKALKRHRRS